MSDSESNEIKLKKNLNVFNAISLIVGSVIGSGIFITSSNILKDTGSVGLSLIVWVNCGILSLLGSLCYAELGSMIPSSGGDYIYIMKAFGSFPAFVRIWVEIMIIRPSLNAIVALTFAIYLLKPIYPICSPPKSALLLLSNICIFLVTIINCLSVRATTLIQDIFSGIKVCALVSIIVAGIYFLATGHHDTLATGFQGTISNFTIISLAHYAGLFSYNGWQFLNTVVEEMKNLKRDLPLSLIFSIIFITLIYVLTIISYYSILTKHEIVTTNAIAIAFGNKIHIGFSYFMSAGVACSTFGAVNGLIFTSSRLFFIAARHNHMPGFVNTINTRFKTPIMATIFIGLLSSVYTLIDDITTLLNYTSIMNWITVVLSVVTLLVFRRTWPNADRPIRVFIAIPIMFILLVTALIVASIVAAPLEAGMGILITLSAVPIHLLAKFVFPRVEKFRKFMALVERTVSIVTKSCQEKI